MSERFLELSLERRRSFLDEAGIALKRSPMILEKDIWVCWALEVLFSLEQPAMVFKGGTSLSKVYKAIKRFSEDLDITFDHRSSGDALLDPIGASGNQRQKFAERMKQYTAETVTTIIKPHFEQAASGVDVTEIEIAGDEQEQLLVSFESIFPNNYVLPRIKLEFGAKNAIDPHEQHIIEPDVLNWQPASRLEFPRATVSVLSAERTFWEKATLAHAEVTRRNHNENVERYSRHWYDLAQLVDCGIADRALEDIQIRDSVIETKSALFGVAGVDYSLVARGECCLIDEALSAELARDYAEMREASMFDGEPPIWSEIANKIKTLETRINSSID